MNQRWNDKTGRWEPPTHGDLVRSMSNEELAKLFDELVNGGSESVFNYCSLDWLRQPAEE